MGGEFLEVWQGVRAVIVGAIESNRARTGRPTDRDKALKRLDELAAGGPITREIKRQVAGELEKPMWRITRWNSERK